MRICALQNVYKHRDAKCESFSRTLCGKTRRREGRGERGRVSNEGKREMGIRRREEEEGVSEGWREGRGGIGGGGGGGGGGVREEEREGNRGRESVREGG